MHYLATTSIFEIWDLNSEMLFLGPWCFAGGENENIIKDKDRIIIPSPWNSGLKIKDATDYCYRIYKDLIVQLSKCLNSIHGTAYSVEYWRIIIGPWLLFFINVFYDRYKRIENSVKLFPDLYTRVLPLRDCDLVTLDTYDFIRKVQDCSYNLKLYSLVAHSLIPEKIVESPVFCPNKIDVFRYSWRRNIYYAFLKNIPIFPENHIVLSEMYHLSRLDELLLSMKGIRFLDFSPPKNPGLNIRKDIKIRKQILLKGSSDNFQSFIHEVIPKAFPISYLENYNFYRHNIPSFNSLKIVGSANSWYFNERFKYFAAEAHAKGANLVDFQHGGCFGIFLSIPDENLSLEKDVLYTWGWSDSGNNKIKALSSPYLSRLKNKHTIKNNKILFVSSGIMKYPHMLYSFLLPDDMPKYFKDKKIFFDNLPGHIVSHILYRLPLPYRRDWKEKEFIKSKFPSIRFLLNDTLVDWMKIAKLVIIDHNATSFLEAFTINVPSVLFWDHDVMLIRPEAEEYFSLLRKAGILYKNPQGAANKVNEIYKDPQSWWLSPEVQKAKNIFCDNFAYTNKNWLAEWSREFQLNKG